MSAVPLALTPSLIPEALRATSCEALAEPAAVRAAPRAQTSTKSRNCRIARPSSDARPSACIPVRVTLRREPLVGGVARHRRLELEPEEDVDHVRVEL